MSLLTAVLLGLHVFSAIGWMGAAMVFGMIIGPLVPRLAPATRGELIVKLFPKYIRYADVFAIMTPVLGLGTALAFGGGSFAIFAPTSSFGVFISAGAGLSVVVLVLAFGVITPSAHKLVHLTEELMKNPGPPSSELIGASNRLRVGATVGLVLLIAILVCMVAAASF